MWLSTRHRLDSILHPVQPTSEHNSILPWFLASVVWSYRNHLMRRIPSHFQVITPRHGAFVSYNAFHCSRGSMCGSDILAMYMRILESSTYYITRDYHSTNVDQDMSVVQWTLSDSGRVCCQDIQSFVSLARRRTLGLNFLKPLLCSAVATTLHANLIVLFELMWYPIESMYAAHGQLSWLEILPKHDRLWIRMHQLGMCLILSTVC